MTISKFRLTLPACSFLASLSLSVPALADPVQFFENEVRPILAENCFTCHGPEKQKGDLRLDSAATMLQGASRGPVVKAGDPESLLFEVLAYTGEVKMPPDGKLPDEKIAVLQKWVADGAVWPDYGDAAKAAAKPAGIDLEAGRKHWAYQPISKTSTPQVADATWAKTGLDPFILQRIEAEGLQPAAQADKRLPQKGRGGIAQGLDQMAVEALGIAVEERAGEILGGRVLRQHRADPSKVEPCAEMVVGVEVEALPPGGRRLFLVAERLLREAVEMPGGGEVVGLCQGLVEDLDAGLRVSLLEGSLGPAIAAVQHRIAGTGGMRGRGLFDHARGSI